MVFLNDFIQKSLRSQNKSSESGRNTDMKKANITLFLAIAATLSAHPTDSLAEAPPASLEKIYAGKPFSRPLQYVLRPDGSGDRLLVEQTGKVYVLSEDEASDERTVFLDLSDRKLAAKDGAFEEGLLNISFHPKFKENHKFYLYYSQQNPKRSIISEFTLSKDDPSKPDMESERIVMTIPQPFWNHNSGNMLFGPDGYLYICLGDGGKGNDPHKLAQNLWVLNGKILRIDVDSRSGALGYGIPEDNPFAQKKGIRPEIWTYGMRNPWGIYIEPGNGRFWCADVGQGLWEEINIIEKGGNYGWSFREGTKAFELRKDPVPEGTKFIEPIHEYGRADGISITGGFVYRGSKMPGLKGYYIYGDWGTGNIWALKYENGKVVENTKIIEGNPAVCKPSAFSEDANNEIIVISWSGSLFRME
jgi:glucose/arabinose dehydrogenase